MFFGTVEKCPDARRSQTREEAYLNGTLTKWVCEQRRRWAFFNSPADIAQTVEHIHGKDGVNGSIPFVGSLISPEAKSMPANVLVAGEEGD